MAAQARGLLNFIGEVRKIKQKEDEETRVAKELANIRKNFAKERVSSYDRKKYVWKLVYIHMLGYDVDFGHNQISVLLGGLAYTEKAVGYVAAQLLVQETDEVMGIIINLVKNDLDSNVEYAQCLALHAIANSTLQVYNRLLPEVLQLLRRTSSSPLVKKKAALSLIHFVKMVPDAIDHGEIVGLAPALLESRNVGVLTSVSAMLKELAAKAPAIEAYSALVIYVVHLVTRQLMNAAEMVPRPYVYHDFPAPWLLVNLFRFLRHFETPPVQTIADELLPVLRRFVASSPPTGITGGYGGGGARNINSLNATNMVTFEMVELIMTWTAQGSPLMAGSASDSDWAGLRIRSLRFISDKLEAQDQNGRYVALKIINNISRMAGGLTVVRQHLTSIKKSLEDPDVSVKRRAIDLLFVIADSDSATIIVEQLLVLLELDTREVPESLREELVLKIAIIAERNATDLQWYIGVILRLLNIAGEFVIDEVWHRAVAIVTNNPKLQPYAASKALDLIQDRPAEPKAVALAAYLLGEFGFLISGPSADPEITMASGDEQYELLRQHFQDIDERTGALIMTTFAKMSNLYGGGVGSEIDKLFVHLERHWTLEVQQRALEYRRIRSGVGGVGAEEILREMPAFPELQENALLKRLRELTVESGDAEEAAALGGGFGDAAGRAASPQTTAETRDSIVDLLNLAAEETPKPPPPPARRDPNLILSNDGNGDGGGGTGASGPSNYGADSSGSYGGAGSPSPRNGAGQYGADGGGFGAAMGPGNGAGVGAGGGAGNSAGGANGGPDANGAGGAGGVDGGAGMDSGYGQGPAGNGGGFASSGGGAPARTGNAHLRGLVWRTYLQRQGVLYDDDMVSVLSQQRTNGASSKIFLCVRNKTGGQMTEAAVQFAPMQGVKVRADPVQSTIAARNQVTTMVHADCVGPVADFPIFRVMCQSAATGQPVQVNALLPVRGSCFQSQPAQPLPSATFVSKWKEWAGDKASVFVLSATKVVESTPELERKVARDDLTCVKKQLTRYLNLDMIEGMNYDDSTFSLGGFFNVVKPDPNPNGDQSKVGVLVSFKVADGSINCAIRSGHALITRSLTEELGEVYGA